MPEPRNPVFDRLFSEGAAAVLAGTHRHDEPPTEGGRYPVSILGGGMAPGVIARLDALMREALTYVGPGHFLTGRPDSVHVTFRALETYREAASPTEPVVPSWIAAVDRAAAATAPLEFRLAGLTMSTSGLMAQLEPVDDRPWIFMDRLRDELGEHAWFEDTWMKRDIFYSSLLHFAADMRDPEGLVDWVAARRELPEPVPVTLTELRLVRFRYTEDGDERYVRPIVWHTAPFTG